MASTINSPPKGLCKRLLQVNKPKIFCESPICLNSKFWRLPYHTDTLPYTGISTTIHPQREVSQAWLRHKSFPNQPRPTCWRELQAIPWTTSSRSLGARPWYHPPQPQPASSEGYLSHLLRPTLGAYLVDRPWPLRHKRLHLPRWALLLPTINLLKTTYLACSKVSDNSVNSSCVR